MNDQTKIHSTNIEDTSLANIEAKAQVYLSTETEFITDKGSNIHDIAANLNNTLSRRSSVAQIRNQVQSTNNYIANTTANNSATTITTYLVKENLAILLLLSPEQIKALEGYALNNDLVGLRAYLEKIKKELQEQLKTAGSTMATKIKNALGGINQLLGASDAVLLSALFNTQTVTQPAPTPPPTTPAPPAEPPPPTTPEPEPVPEPELVPPPLEPLEPNPIYDLGIIIDEEISELLTSLLEDSSFYEEFFAEVIKPEWLDKLYLTPEQKLMLEQLATTGSEEELKKFLKQLITELSNLITQLQKDQTTGLNSALITKLKNSIGVFQQLLTVSADVIREKLFEKKPTGFWIFKADAFEQIAERIRIKINLLGLLTKLVHAKMDSANMIHQIMTEQSGYQKMNIEKIDQRQSEAISNFLNTRKKEVVDRVNNHNNIEKSKIEKQNEQEKEQNHGNLFLRLLGGIVSFIAGILATIFSGGIAAPIVVSLISTSFETFINYREYLDEAKNKKKSRSNLRKT